MMSRSKNASYFLKVGKVGQRVSLRSILFLKAGSVRTELGSEKHVSV